MNLYHLRYFVTLAHLEHYTKAADVLAITQPSLSHAISSLEEELGVKLFEKNGRNVSLTKYGKSFLEDVEQTLNRLDSSVNGLQLAGKGEGQIDVAFLRTLGVDFMPKIIRSFLNANKGKQIHFNLFCDKVLTGDILTGLKEKKYDIGFCSKFDDEPLIEFIPVAKQDLVVIVPPEHPLAEKSEIHLEETLPYKQIIFKKRSGLRQIIDQLFKSIGQYPDVAFEIDEDQVAAGFVANDFGICIAPDIPILHSLNLKILPLVSPSRKPQGRFFIRPIKRSVHLQIYGPDLLYHKGQLPDLRSVSVRFIGQLSLLYVKLFCFMISSYLFASASRSLWISSSQISSSLFPSVSTTISAAASYFARRFSNRSAINETFLLFSSKGRS